MMKLIVGDMPFWVIHMRWVHLVRAHVKMSKTPWGGPHGDMGCTTPSVELGSTLGKLC
jgi:hypothetical protein